MKRRKKNPYVGDARSRQARERGYPARSVFKLEEIDRRLHLLRRGMTVLAGLAIGIGLAVLFMMNRQTPTHDESVSAVPSLAVIAVGAEHVLTGDEDRVFYSQDIYRSADDPVARVIDLRPALEIAFARRWSRADAPGGAPHRSPWISRQWARVVA